MTVRPRSPRVLTAALALGIITLANVSPSSAETLRVGSAVFAQHSTSRVITSVFTPEVVSTTGGRHEVQVFPGSELGGIVEAIQQVRNGTIFGAWASTAYFNTFAPKLGLTNLPFVFPNRSVAFKMFDGPFGEEVTKTLEGHGFVLLSFFELGYRQITNSKREAKTPADLAGLKIRSQPNPVQINAYQALGMTTAEIDPSEMFSALRQGVIDGQENPYAVINLFKMDEAKQKYLLEVDQFYDVMLFVASKRVLDRMKPEDRAAIVAAGRKTALAQRPLAAEEDGTHKEELKKKGVVITELTAEQKDEFRKKVNSAYDLVRQRLGAPVVDQFITQVKEASVGIAATR